MGKMFLPFILKSLPVRKLALINFDNDPDEVYRRFELQLIGTREDPRIIAYRSDGYVDVYDHIGSEGDDFRSYGKGLHARVISLGCFSAECFCGRGSIFVDPVNVTAAVETARALSTPDIFTAAFAFGGAEDPAVGIK